jgi:hypothetical protein
MKPNREGYLLIDHRATGINAQGKSVSGQAATIEMATHTCSHCHRIIILNPMRMRDRHYCPKCDHYICDDCEAARVASGYACMPLTAHFYEMKNRSVRLGAKD